MSIEKGFYKHYKGGLYEVTGFAKHTETEEQLVIYRDTKGNIWARPETMWTEKVNDKLRFERFIDQRDGQLKFLLFKHKYKKDN